MHFEIAHEFDIPLDALELAFLSPELCRRLAMRLPNVESIQQKQHSLVGNRLERTWSCRPNVRVPAFAQEYVKPEMMAWDEHATYDLREHASTWTITPHVKAEWKKYFASHGTYRLTSLESGRTKRTVIGVVDIRVPVVKQVAEKFVVGELRRMFEIEAETLRDMATLV